jgi:hypothetical protein
MDAEGWFLDPYGAHETRWFSDGTPTSLVRDGTVESTDDPPATPYRGPLVRPADSPAADGADLRRADGADAGSFDPDAAVDAAWEAFGDRGGVN